MTVPTLSELKAHPKWEYLDTEKKLDAYDRWSADVISVSGDATEAQRKELLEKLEVERQQIQADQDGTVLDSASRGVLTLASSARTGVAAFNSQYVKNIDAALADPRNEKHRDLLERRRERALQRSGRQLQEAEVDEQLAGQFPQDAGMREFIEAKGFEASTKALVNNFGSIVANGFAESAPMMLSPIAGGIVGGISTGNPVGAGVGAFVGGAAPEFTISYREALQEIGKENGFNTASPEGLAEAMADEKTNSAAVKRGLIRAGIIGGVDAATGGAGAKLGVKAGEALVGKTADTLAKELTKNLTAVGVSAAIGAPAGSAGEFAAQLASGQELDAKDIALEGIVQGGTAFGQAVTETARTGLTFTTPDEVSKGQRFPIDGELHEVTETEPVTTEEGYQQTKVTTKPVTEEASIPEEAPVTTSESEPEIVDAGARRTDPADTLTEEDITDEAWQEAFDAGDRERVEQIRRARHRFRGEDGLLPHEREQLDRDYESQLLEEAYGRAVTLDEAIDSIGGLISPSKAASDGAEFNQLFNESGERKGNQRIGRFKDTGIQYDEALPMLRDMGFYFDSPSELKDALERVDRGETVRGIPRTEQPGELFSRVPNQKQNKELDQVLKNYRINPISELEQLVDDSGSGESSVYTDGSKVVKDYRSKFQGFGMYFDTKTGERRPATKAEFEERIQIHNSQFPDYKISIVNKSGGAVTVADFIDGENQNEVDYEERQFLEDLGWEKIPGFKDSFRKGDIEVHDIDYNAFWEYDDEGNVTNWVPFDALWQRAKKDNATLASRVPDSLSANDKKPSQKSQKGTTQEQKGDNQPENTPIQPVTSLDDFNARAKQNARQPLASETMLNTLRNVAGESDLKFADRSAAALTERGYLTDTGTGSGRSRYRVTAAGREMLGIPERQPTSADVKPLDREATEQAATDINRDVFNLEQEQAEAAGTLAGTFLSGAANLGQSQNVRVAETDTVRTGENVLNQNPLEGLDQPTRNILNSTVTSVFKTKAVPEELRNTEFRDELKTVARKTVENYREEKNWYGPIVDRKDTLRPIIREALKDYAKNYLDNQPDTDTVTADESVTDTATRSRSTDNREVDSGKDQVPRVQTWQERSRALRENRADAPSQGAKRRLARIKSADEVGTLEKSIGQYILDHGDSNLFFDLREDPLSILDPELTDFALTADEKITAADYALEPFTEVLDGLGAKGKARRGLSAKPTKKGKKNTTIHTDLSIAESVSAETGNVGLAITALLEGRNNLERYILSLPTEPTEPVPIEYTITRIDDQPVNNYAVIETRNGGTLEMWPSGRHNYLAADPRPEEYYDLIEYEQVGSDGSKRDMVMLFRVPAGEVKGESLPYVTLTSLQNLSDSELESIGIEPEVIRLTGEGKPRPAKPKPKPKPEYDKNWKPPKKPKYKKGPRKSIHQLEKEYVRDVKKRGWKPKGITDQNQVDEDTPQLRFRKKLVDVIDTLAGNTEVSGKFFRRVGISTTRDLFFNQKKSTYPGMIQILYWAKQEGVNFAEVENLIAPFAGGNLNVENNRQFREYLAEIDKANISPEQKSKEFRKALQEQGEFVRGIPLPDSRSELTAESLKSLLDFLQYNPEARSERELYIRDREGLPVFGVRDIGGKPLFESIVDRSNLLKQEKDRKVREWLEEDQKIYENAKKFTRRVKNTKDLLKWVAETDPDGFGPLAKYLAKNLPKFANTDIVWLEPDARSFAETGRLHLSLIPSTEYSGTGVNINTAIHEIVHGITSAEIWNNFDHLTPEKWREQLQRFADTDLPIGEIARAYMVARDQRAFLKGYAVGAKATDQFVEQESRRIFSTATALDKRIAYALANVHEFVAMAFEDREFQQWLDSIPDPDRKQSIWKTFVDAIKKMLRIPVSEGSLLETVVVASDNTFLNKKKRNRFYGGKYAGKGSRLNEADTKRDADYLKAVEAGDMETAQRMVDEAAKAAGYDVGPVYHGSPSDQFTEFDPDEIGSATNEVRRGKGFYFFDEREKAQRYAMDSGFVLTVYLKGDIKIVPAKRSFDNANEYIVKNPNQIKSADPVTYDKDGNVIPLSQRFNDSQDSILYSFDGSGKPGKNTDIETNSSARGENIADPSQADLSELDREYLKAVEDSDLIQAEKLLRQSAKDAGFTDTLWTGSSNAITFNSLSPNTQQRGNIPGIFFTKNRRAAAGYALLKGAANSMTRAERLRKAADLNVALPESPSLLKVYANIKKPLKSKLDLNLLIRAHKKAGINFDEAIGLEYIEDNYEGKSGFSFNEYGDPLFDTKAEAYNDFINRLNDGEIESFAGNDTDALGENNPLTWLFSDPEIGEIYLTEGGFDSVLYQDQEISALEDSNGNSYSDRFNNTTVVIQQKDNIASGEVVVRDESGNIIPPSKRFPKADTPPKNGGPLLQENFPDSPQGFYDRANKFIGLLPTANPSTLLHEFIHAGREMMAGTPELKTLENFYGVKDGNWTRDQEETFARHGERYFRDGKAPKGASQKVRDAFATFADVMRKIYRTLKGSPIEEKVPKEVREFFDTVILAGDTEADVDPSIRYDRTQAAPAGELAAAAVSQNSIHRIPVEPLSGDVRPNRDVLFDAARNFGKTVKYKGQARRTYGTYNTTNSRVSIRYEGDLDTTAHELGHAIDDQFNIGGTAEAEGLLPDIDAELLTPTFQATSAKDYDLGQKRAEGFAEFIRALIVNPDAARLEAPKTAELFDRLVSPKTVRALNQFSRDIRAWEAGSAGEQILANVQLRPDSKLAKAIKLFRGAKKGNQDGFVVSGWDRVAAKWLDDKHPFLKAVNYIEEANGEKPLPSSDPRIMARLLQGIGSKEQEVLENGMVNAKGNFVLPGGVEWLLEPFGKQTTEQIDKDLRDATALLVAERTVELADRFGREDALTGAGAGIRTDLSVAQEAIAEYKKDPARYARLKEAGNRYRQWADANLKYMVEKGRLSQEAYDNITAENTQYVALSRIMETAPGEEMEAMAFGSGKNLGSVSEVLRKIKGSSKTIRNPYIVLLESSGKIMRESDRNEVLSLFADMIDNDRRLYDGDPNQFASVGSRIQEGTGAKNTQTIYRNGQKEVWQFDDDIHKALKGYKDAYQLPWIATFMAKALKWGITNMPAFAIRNLIRDTQGRFLVSRAGIREGLASSLPTRGQNNLRKLKLGGGDQAGYYTRGETDYMRVLDMATRELATDKRNILISPKEFVRFFGSEGPYMRLLAKGEQSNRLAEYRASYAEGIKRGYNQHDAHIFASAQARDLMDFAIAGEHARFVNQVIPFFNAAIQGTRRNVIAVKENSGQVGIRFLLFAVMPTIIIRAIVQARGDEEEYEEMPAYLRDFYWNIKLTDDLWLRIPKNFEAGVLASGVDRAISKSLGYKFGLRDYLSSLSKSSLPVDFETAISGPFSALSQAYSNKDFFRDKAIVPSYQSGVDLDAVNAKGERLRNTDYASRLGKGWQMIGEAIGLSSTDVGKKFFDARVGDFLFKSTLGNFGETLTRASNIGRSDTSNKLGIKDFGLFVNSPAYAAQSVQEVYKLAENNGLRQNKMFDDLDELIGQYFNATKQEAREKNFDSVSEYRDFIGRQIRREAKRVKPILEAEIEERKG